MPVLRSDAERMGQITEITDLKHLIDQMLGHTIETKTELSLDQIQSLAIIKSVLSQEKNLNHYRLINVFIDAYMTLMVSNQRKSRTEAVKLFDSYYGTNRRLMEKPANNVAEELRK